MPAASSRRRATAAVGATRSSGTPSSHLVLVPLPATEPSSVAFADLSAGALAKVDTVQPARDPRQAFCAKLRLARERRGIPLSGIAAATKVSASHLAALERNDLSRWPAGIYRRAWIRGYAAAVGLPVDATLDEFLAAFEPPPPPPPADEAPSDRSAVTDASLRLTLAATRTPAWARLRAHVIDLAVAVLLAILVTWVTGSSSWVAVGVLALCAYAPIVATIKRLATKTMKV